MVVAEPSRSEQHHNNCDPLQRYWEDSVATYRCFLVSGERIQSVQSLECADDAEVLRKGAALLDSKPEHQAIEIWEHGRFVKRLPRPVTSHKGTPSLG